MQYNKKSSLPASADIKPFSFTPKPRYNSTSLLLSAMILAQNITAAAAKCGATATTTYSPITECEPASLLAIGLSCGDGTNYKNHFYCPGSDTRLFKRSKRPLSNADILNECRREEERVKACESKRSSRNSR